MLVSFLDQQMFQSGHFVMKDVEGEGLFDKCFSGVGSC